MSIIITDEHAKAILALLGPEHAEIAAAITEKLEPVPNAEDYRDAAEREHASDELEIDQGAPVSPGGDPGAWVQAWVWVSDEDAGIEGAA